MVAKRQGREKPAKIDQRKVKGMSDDRSEDSEKTALLAKQNLHRAGPGGGKNIKGGGKALSLSLPFACTASLSLSLSLSPMCVHSFSFSLPHMHALSLYLSPRQDMWALSLSFSLTLSLFLSQVLAHSPTLFSSRLWVSMPSCLENVFSCYHLTKIEL